MDTGLKREPEQTIAIAPDETGFSVSLPPHSVAALTIRTGRNR